jgi:hypothetical protein
VVVVPHAAIASTTVATTMPLLGLLLLVGNLRTERGR